MPAMCGLTTIPLAPVRLQNQRRSEASRGLRRGLLFENRIAKRANLNCAFFLECQGNRSGVAISTFDSSGPETPFLR